MRYERVVFYEKKGNVVRRYVRVLEVPFDHVVKRFARRWVSAYAIFVQMFGSDVDASIDPCALTFLQCNASFRHC